MRAGVTASTQGDGRRDSAGAARLIEMVTQGILPPFGFDPGH